jgi:hypothetical protein
MTEFGELTLLATGEWQAMQRSDTKTETKAEAKSEPAKPAELTGAETLSLISTAAAVADESRVQSALLAAPAVEPKRAANGK